MKTHNVLLIAVSAPLALPLHADPRISSWYTADSGKYARIFQTTAAETARTASTTWSRGQGSQTQPTYAGVSEVVYSNDWVYIRTTGLAGHIMGPWYLDANKTQDFPNFPSNTGTIYRIPRNPTIPAAKTLTGLGATGRMVNGVSMFDSRDAFSYRNASGQDATPVNGLTGDGIWNRDGYHNEGVTFDPALAHQAGNNYHYHAQPIALRYQLGDHAEYNAVTNRYTESAAPVTKHSPIVAWAADGLPVYGPYGYSVPLDPNSGVRRMISGFALRNGANGTTNITVRQILPLWAQRVQNRTTLTAAQYGPAVNATYALGHYIEDFDYRGDLGQALGGTFDLNEQNARFCITPEFPSGTWAYFTTINADGTPAYPYTTGRQYYGSPTGGGVASIAETVTTAFRGGPNKEESVSAFALNPANGNVVLTWSAVEGGTYQPQTSATLSAWANLGSTINASTDAASVTDPGAATGNARRFYKVNRTALAAFDSTGFNYTGGGGGGGGSNAVAPGGNAAAGTTVTILITLPTTPPLPPANRVPTSITLDGSIIGTAISRPSQATAQATFAIPAGTAGLKTIVVTFNPAPTYTMTGAFTVN